MTSKRKNYQKSRRRMRRLEKASTATKDIMIGRACRRFYGAGVAK